MLKISICVPTFNRPKDLKNLIESYLTLTYSNSELVVFDDLGIALTKRVVSSYRKKDSRIVYQKNPRNLGFTENLRQSFSKVDGDIVVFMGDDDLFLEPDTLDYIAHAFSEPDVGVVKDCQILYKDGKVDQIFPIDTNAELLISFNPGPESLLNFWFESLSITGLAFRNDKHLQSLITHHQTLYPQVELVGKICLTKKSVRINRHLVGVQSHSGQLNCASYDLNDVRTNILEDWMHVYQRINTLAREQNNPCISQGVFARKFTEYLIMFYPYNTLTNGKLDTLILILSSLKYYTLIWQKPRFFLSAFLVMLLPKDILKLTVKGIKKLKTIRGMSAGQINNYNRILSEYYKQT